LRVDRGAASQYGLSPGAVGAVVQMVTSGLKLSDFRPAGLDEPVDIVLRLPPDQRTISSLDQLRIETKDGPVPISNFVGWFLLIFLFAILWEWMPALVRKWGRAKATIAFFGIVLITDVAMLIFLVVYNTYFVRNVLHLFGVSELQIPPGW